MPLSKRERDNINAYKWLSLVDFIARGYGVTTLPVTIEGEEKRLRITKRLDGKTVIQIIPQR